MGRAIPPLFPVACFALFFLAEPSAAQEPKRVALLVGIETYQKPRFENLNFAEDDVDAVGDRLQKLGFDVTTLKGRKATRSAIAAAAERLVRNLSKEDIALVMLSGHGQQMDVQQADGTWKNDGFFCPYDAVDGDPSTLYSLSLLTDDVLAPHVGKSLLLVDACRNNPSQSRGKGIEGKVIALPEGVAVLFSCRKGQKSWEIEALGHGAFTHCVLDGLNGAAAREQQIEWDSLTAYVKYRMSQPDILDHLPKDIRQDPIPAGGVPWTILGRLAPKMAPSPRASHKSTVTPPSDIQNRLGMRLRLIPAGQFWMGSTPAQQAAVQHLDPDFKEDWLRDESPQHKVKITQPFYLSVHEVTRGQFAKFVEAKGYRTDAERDPQGGGGFDNAQGIFKRDVKYTWRDTGFVYGDDHPVVNVSWNDAVAFCKWLSQEEPGTYQLPTEAQWEYACRAGSETLWSFGNDDEQIALHGNVADRAAKRRFPGLKTTISADDGAVFTSRVGRYRPNGFGLFDMHGNACEWCRDRYGESYYGSSQERDLGGPLFGSSRVLRGGGWDTKPANARSADRLGHRPSDRSINSGFRVSRSLN